MPLAMHSAAPPNPSPPVHHATLQDMDEEHAQAVSTVWAEEATEFVGRLKEHTMSGPKVSRINI